MIVTIASTTLSNYQVSGSTAALRIYLTESFVSSDGVLHIADDQIYKSISCTVEDNIVTIPAFTIDSTTDGLDNTRARYSAILYDANGDEVAPYVSDFLVYPSPSSTTWADIIAVNNIYVPRPPNTYLTATQIAALFADLPDGLTQFTGYVNLADYDSLAAAVSQIGSANKILNISIDSAVSTAITIPSTLFLNFINGAKLVKSGSGSITFQGAGLVDAMSQRAYFQSFSAGDITWSGSTYPQDVSTELFDTGNNSSTDRVKMCDLAFANDARVVIHVYPRTFTGNAFSGLSMRDGHSILLKSGEHQNTLNTRNYPSNLSPLGSDLPAFVMGDDSTFEMEPGAVFYESENDYNTYLVYTKEGARNVTISGHFKGQGALQDNGSGGVLLRNAVNSKITDFLFDSCASYNAVIGGHGSEGVGENCSIENGTILTTLNQVIAVTNGRHVSVKNVKLLLKDGVGTAAFSPLDVEMNSHSDVLEDVVIDGIDIDVRDAGFSSIVVALQGAGDGIKRASVSNVTINGQDIGTASGTSDMSIGLYAVGVENLQAHDIHVQGGGNGAVRLILCRYTNLYNCTALQCGAAVGVIDVQGCADSHIFQNVLSESADTVSQSTNIAEYEVEYLVSSSGSTITRLNGNDSKFFQHFIGLKVVLNGTEYTINGGTFTVNEPTLQTLTTTVAVGTLTAQTIASASGVDIGTDTLTAPSNHNLNNGARMKYTAGTAPIGGLTDGQTVFIANKTATTFQVSATEGGSVINLTGTGTGNQTFTPVMRTKFSSNGYWDNYAPDGITLESTGTSKIFSDAMRTVADWVAPAQITSNQNDYNPGSNAYRLDLSTDASRNITGLVFTFPAQINGEKHRIDNTGAQNIVLKHQDSNSTAANRFLCNTGADITLTSNQTAFLEYNGSRWLVSRALTILAASEITNTATGNISSTTVQAAINELDAEKAPLASPVLVTPDIGVATGTSLAATGLIKSSGTAGVGYATGAGGTVTQSTDKSTGVTLNKPTGLITMNNAALAADTVVSFTLTNSTIETTDALILNHASGGTPGKYGINGRCGSGSAVIDLTNISTGSLSEAIVIRFVLVKAVSA